MRVNILYHPNSEHEREVTEYQRNFKEAKGHKPKLVSLETVEGAEMARLYDVVVYPAVLVMTQDGVLQKLWQGSPLPLMDEVDSYMGA